VDLSSFKVRDPHGSAPREGPEMKRVSVVGSGRVLAPLVVVLAACGPSMQWAVVRDSGDLALLARCVEGRQCEATYGADSDPAYTQAATNLLRDLLAQPGVHPDQVSYLVKQGADPSAVDDLASNADLSEERVVEILKRLVDGGFRPADASGWAMQFVEGKRLDAARFLFEHGARIAPDTAEEHRIWEIGKRRDIEALRVVAPYTSNLRFFEGWLGPDGWPEGAAVLCETLPTDATLGIYAHAPPYTALEIALHNLSFRRTLGEVIGPCIERLIARGAAVVGRPHSPLRMLLHGTDASQWSASLKAVLAALLAKGADVNDVGGHSGESPLHYAVNWPNPDAVSMLLQHGADPNLKDNRGVTPLERALGHGNNAIIRALLEKCGDPNSRDSSGRSVLLAAISARVEPALVRLLLDRGADPMAVDPSTGKTAVQLAIDMGKKEYVELMAPRVAVSELKAAQDKAKAEQNQREAAAIAERARAEAAAALGGGGGGGGGGAVAAGGGGGEVQLGVRRPRPAKLPVVAVFDVELKGVSMGRNTRENLSELLSIELVATGYFQVVPREDLKTRLTDVKAGTYKACYDQSCQIELGRELAAEQTLSVKVMKLGAECSSTLTLFDLKKGTAVGAVTGMSTCAEPEVIKTLRRLVERLTH
jgi:hypothetical protein